MPIKLKVGNKKVDYKSEEAKPVLAAYDTRSSNKPKKPAKLGTPSKDNAPKPQPKGPLAPFIDKLSVTLSIPEADYEEIHNAVYTAINEKTVFQSAQNSKGYKVTRLIAIPGSVERVHFQFDPKNGEPPHARLEFNPSKLGPAGMDWLHATLTMVFDDGWHYVLEHGRITRLDVAVDLPDARMHHFLILPARGLASAHYKTDGKLKSLYVGKEKGNQTALYSKSHEQKSKNKPLIASTVRLERKLRKPKITSLLELEKLDNVFLGPMLIEPVPSAPEGKLAWLWPLFLDSVGVRGEIAALALLEEKIRTKFRKHLKEQAVEWWDPEAIWTHWPKVVSDLQLKT